MKSIVIVCYVAFVGLMLTGSLMNIYKFIKLDFKAPYKAEIIRAVAIPTGLGGVIGFIDIKD